MRRVVTTTTRQRAGASRFTRRAKKPPKYADAVALGLRRSDAATTYPEMTKKTSTPTMPPGIHVLSRCQTTTAPTATARSPSMSGR